MLQVALFPIPNSVNFPGVPCPLHVFEPRYRQMAHHCVREKMLMGVCHTEKVLHHHNREQTVEEALASNQATYKPCAIFSAGPVTILQELDDGRMLIQVDNVLRLRRVEEQQTLPFSIWSCEELHDEPCSQGSELALKQSQAKILQRLIVITHGNEKAQKMLKSAHWQTMAAQKFSFAVAGLLGMEAATAQALLELTNAQKRLDCVLEMINGIGPAVS